MFNSNLNSEITLDILKARIWIGLLILLFWLLLIAGAAVTFPFVGHITRGQNILYGVIVGIPFLSIMTAYLILVIKDFKVFASERKSGQVRS